MNEQRVILLVDDSVDDLVLMREGFARAQCRHLLREAHDGEEAIAYLAGAGHYSDRTKYPLPTIILLDMNMPKQNGCDVLRWLRAQPGLKYLTVFILTASMRDVDVERAYSVGATGFLVKPSTLDELANIARWLCEWIKINHFPTPREAEGRERQAVQE